jgi:fatty acid desaturase
MQIRNVLKFWILFKIKKNWNLFIFQILFTFDFVQIWILFKLKICSNFNFVYISIISYSKFVQVQKHQIRNLKLFKFSKIKNKKEKKKNKKTILRAFVGQATITPAIFLKTGPMICLKRIYNFWCSVLVYTPFILCSVTLHGVFMYFPKLTY